MFNYFNQIFNLKNYLNSSKRLNVLFKKKNYQFELKDKRISNIFLIVNK